MRKNWMNNVPVREAIWFYVSHMTLQQVQNSISGGPYYQVVRQPLIPQFLNNVTIHTTAMETV